MSILIEEDWDPAVMAGMPRFSELPFGALIGQVELLDCIPVIDAEAGIPEPVRLRKALGVGFGQPNCLPSPARASWASSRRLFP